MTALYFPASMRSLRNSTSFFVYRGIGNITFLVPIREVSKANIGFCHINRDRFPGRPVLLQRVLAAPERALADSVEDDVIRSAVLGEVFLGVVDDRVGSERSHCLDVLGVADSSDVGIKVFASGHSCGAEGSGCAVDEDPLSLPEICRSEVRRCQGLPRRRPPRPLRSHVGRLFRQRGVFRHADELRVCAEAARIDAVDVVTGLEQGDACATCFDRPGQFAAGAGFSWSDQIA